MLPNFLHIGSAKAASTFLWKVYHEHPDIYVPGNYDNVNFFVGSYHKGLKWYEDTYFSEWNGQKAIGETTNSYMLFGPALERIQRDLPNVKISMILRDPVEGCFLQWAMQKESSRKHGREGNFFDFERMLDNYAWQLFRMWAEPRFYAYHLKNIYRYFPKERILVMFYDDLKKDPKAFVRKFFEFLEVDPEFVPSCVNTVVGFPGTLGNDTRDNDLKKGISTEYEEELKLVFREDIEELEVITGRDLSGWK